MGGLALWGQGNGGGRGKVAALKGAIATPMVQKPDLTLNDLAAELVAGHGNPTCRFGFAVFAWPRPRTQKRPSCPRAEQTRGVRSPSRLHHTDQLVRRNLFARLGFIDETALKMNFAKTTEWSTMPRHVTGKCKPSWPPGAAIGWACHR